MSWARTARGRESDSDSNELRTMREAVGCVCLCCCHLLAALHRSCYLNVSPHRSHQDDLLIGWKHGRGRPLFAFRRWMCLFRLLRLHACFSSSFRLFLNGSFSFLCRFFFSWWKGSEEEGVGAIRNTSLCVRSWLCCFCCHDHALVLVSSSSFLFHFGRVIAFFVCVSSSVAALLSFVLILILILGFLVLCFIVHLIIILFLLLASLFFFFFLLLLLLIIIIIIIILCF